MLRPDRHPFSSQACHVAAAWAALLYLAGLSTAHAQPHNDFSQATSLFNQNNTTFSTQAPQVMLGPTFGGTIMTNGQPSPGSNVSQSVGGRKILDSQFNTSSDGMSAAGFGQTWNANTFGPGVNGIRAVMGRNDSTYSSYNGKEVSNEFKAAFPQGPNLQLKMMPDSTIRRPEMAAQNQKMSALNGFTSQGQISATNVGPSKFSDATVVQAHLFPGYENSGDQKTQMQNLGRELSLQDLNRYDFSGSNSNEPGLPVTKAGGHVESSAGALTSGPALFESWDSSSSSPTSQVRSGGAVTPHMLAPSNGNALMSPMQNSTSSSSSSAPENTSGFTPEVLQKDGISLPVLMGPRTITIPPRPGVQVENPQQ